MRKRDLTFPYMHNQQRTDHSCAAASSGFSPARRVLNMQVAVVETCRCTPHSCLNADQPCQQLRVSAFVVISWMSSTSYYNKFNMMRCVCLMLYGFDRYMVCWHVHGGQSKHHFYRKPPVSSIMHHSALQNTLNVEWKWSREERRECLFSQFDSMSFSASSVPLRWRVWRLRVR